MKQSRFGAVIVAIVLAAASVASAQQPVVTTAEFQTRALRFDNFFQAAQGPSERDINALRMDWLAGIPLDDRGAWRLVPRFDLVSYEQFGLSPGLRVGVQQARGVHNLDLAGGFEWRRPTVDIGDTAGEADIAFVNGQYGYRIVRDVELVASGSLRRHAFIDDPLRNTRDVGLGGGVRYRGFGSRFSPSAGVDWDRRASDDGDEDFVQRGLELAVRSSIDRTYIRVQYRRRFRDYRVDVPEGRNFERDDHRQRFDALIDFPVARYLFGLAGYQVETSDSTRAGRSFTSHSLYGGLAIRMDVHRRPASQEPRGARSDPGSLIADR